MAIKIKGMVIDDKLEALYNAVPDEKKVLKAVGATCRSDRSFDLNIQLLRKAGLVKYTRKDGWQREDDNPPQKVINLGKVIKSYKSTQR